MNMFHSTRRIMSASLLVSSLFLPLDGFSAITARNQVPYVSTVDFQRTVNVSTAPSLIYYVTEFNQKEFLYDDTSESLVVTAKLDGTTFYTGTVAAGEHTITLPTMSVVDPDVVLTLQAVDSQGRKSHVLNQRFRVIDPVAQVITPAQTYTPSSGSLQTTYGIYNNNTNPTTTTTGLTALCAWASTNGYRKVVLPSGTYALDPASTVNLANGVTLDLNGSTFRQTASNIGDSVMVEIAYCTDAHVINGIIEGDLAGHDYSVDPYSEHVRGIRLGSKAEYCSFRDLVVKNITGYGSNTTWGAEIAGPPGAPTYKWAEAFSLGEVDESTGVVITAGVTDRTVCAMIDITPFMSWDGVIMFGKYMGYQGNATDNWTFTASYYDASSNYISSEVGHYYRRLYPPSNAAKARFTLHSSVAPARKVLYVFNAPLPYNCDFINIDHQDVRCVGMVPSGFNNLHVTNNTFTNCGWAQACAAFDAEDGWDGMQDLVFKNNTFNTNPNSEFVALGGHNFLIEGNTMQFRNHPRSGSLVIRNNTIKSCTFEFGPYSRSGHPRIYDNTVQGLAKILTSYSAPGELDREHCVRETEFQGGVAIYGPTQREDVCKMFIYKSVVPAGTFNGRAVDSELDNVVLNTGYPTKWFQLEYCLVTDSTLYGTATYSVLRDSDVLNTTISSSDLRLINNTLTDVELLSYNWVVSQKWFIEGNDITTSKASFLKVNNSFERIGFYNNIVTSSTTSFYTINLLNPNTNGNVAGTQSVTVSGNTFVPTGTTSVAVRAGLIPKPNIAFTLGFLNNTLGTTIQHSSNLTPLANVTWVTPPTVAYTTPANNSTFVAPATISLAATATPAGATTISKVEFYDGEIKLGEDLVSPFTLSYPAAIGSYRFTARAIDSNGTINVSTPILSDVTP